MDKPVEAAEDEVEPTVPEFDCELLLGVYLTATIPTPRPV
jgi:hypothetical protein